MDERYPSWWDQERRLIRQYGCRSHAPGTCPGSPRYSAPFDGVSGDPRFCAPAIPDPWPSPPYVPTRSPEYPSPPYVAGPAAEYGAPAPMAMAAAAAAADAEEVVLGPGWAPPPVAALSPQPYSPLEPHPEELQALVARGCNFGDAPWLGPPHSPHYGPPGSCLNHPYGTCPSVNPYTRFLDARITRGLPTAWDPDADREWYRPSSPTTLAPVARSSVMKKRKTRSKKPKKPKTLTRRDRAAAPSPPNRTFDMADLAAALTAGPGVADPLADLMSQLRVSRRENRPQRATRTKGFPKRKKKGGRRTRK